MSKESANKAEEFAMIAAKKHNNLTFVFLCNCASGACTIGHSSCGEMIQPAKFIPEFKS